MCFLSLFPLLCSAWFPRSEVPNEWFKYCMSNTSSLGCGMSLYCDGSIAFLGVKQLQEDKWLHCFLQFLLTSVHYVEMNRARKKVLCRIANWHYSPYLTLRQSALWRYYKIKQKNPLICSEARFFSSSHYSLTNGWALLQAKHLFISLLLHLKRVSTYKTSSSTMQ